jgi:DNA-binding CsgD family transcriptional regulator
VYIREDLTNEYHMRNYGGPNHTPIGDYQTMNDNLRMDMARLEAKMDVIISMLQNRGNHFTDAPSNHEFSTALTVSESALLRRLTIKQHCVAQLLVKGWKNADIAALMGVTDNTVKLHVSAVGKKMGLKTRGQIAVAFRDVCSKSSTGEYEGASGGLPMNWGDTAHIGMDDKLAPLYAPQKKGSKWD